MSREATLRAYVALIERLAPESVDELPALCAPDVRFRDPFNDVRGIARFQRVTAKMFEDLDEVRFRVDDWALGEAAGYIRWTMRCRPKRLRGIWTIEGMSEVRFDDQDRIAAHIDHWDAAGQLYERLPGLGWVLRRIRRRLAV